MEMYTEWTCMVNVDVLSDSEKLQEMIYNIIYYTIQFVVMQCYAPFFRIRLNRENLRRVDIKDDLRDKTPGRKCPWTCIMHRHPMEVRVHHCRVMGIGIISYPIDVTEWWKLVALPFLFLKTQRSCFYIPDYPLMILKCRSGILCTWNYEELSCSPRFIASQVWFQGWSSWFLDRKFGGIVGLDGTGMLLGNLWIKVYWSVVLNLFECIIMFFWHILAQNSWTPKMNLPMLTPQNWIFWGPYPCYTSSNPSIGGSNDP